MALKYLAENPTASTKEALIHAGYSPSVAKTPGNITKAESFQELLDQYLPQNKLLNRHGELVDSENETVALGAVKLAHQVRGNLNSGENALANITINFEGAPVSYDMEGEVVDITNEYGG